MPDEPQRAKNAGGEDVEEIAAALYDELDALEVEEVWDRAGRTRHGYVETSEVASQMIEAVLAPYLEELSRYQALGLNLEAGEMCKGLLLGLYQFEHESKSQFKDWATDLPLDFAHEVLAAWRRGRPVKLTPVRSTASSRRSCPAGVSPSSDKVTYTHLVRLDLSRKKGPI